MLYVFRFTRFRFTWQFGGTQPPRITRVTCCAKSCSELQNVVIQTGSFRQPLPSPVSPQFSAWVPRMHSGRAKNVLLWNKASYLETWHGAHSRYYMESVFTITREQSERKVCVEGVKKINFNPLSEAEGDPLRYWSMKWPIPRRPQTLMITFRKVKRGPTWTMMKYSQQTTA